jgi:hypothetical protein
MRNNQILHKHSLLVFNLFFGGILLDLDPGLEIKPISWHLAMGFCSGP